MRTNNHWCLRGSSILAVLVMCAGVLMVSACNSRSDAERSDSVGSTADAGAFSLNVGRDVDVCSAYLERLNSTTFDAFDKAPYCGRPESDVVDGFSILRRVDVPDDELYELSERLLSFAQYGDQDGREREREQLLSACRSGGVEEICRARLQEKQDAESRGERWHALLSRDDLEQYPSIAAWRYDPEVDIDNDSLPDRVLMFHLGRCGSGSGGSLSPSPTYAYLMNEDYSRVDESKTKAVFGHPQPEWPGVPSRTYRYVGNQLGVVSYRGTYYFDTFFTSWTDASGQRLNDTDLLSTLGVFHRQGGVTKQVCEFKYTGDKSHQGAMNHAD